MFAPLDFRPFAANTLRRKGSIAVQTRPCSGYLKPFSGGKRMPVYEFECKKCKQIFEVVMTMAEATLKKVVCPICACEDVEKQFSPFAAVTAKKS